MDFLNARDLFAIHAPPVPDWFLAERHKWRSRPCPPDVDAHEWERRLAAEDGRKLLAVECEWRFAFAAAMLAAGAEAANRDAAAVKLRQDNTDSIFHCRTR